MSRGQLLRPDVVRAAHPLDDRVPVTVLTGFLGAGKTTLLNRVLGAHNGERWLVIVNEFGQVGLDHALMVHAHEDGIVELAGGCACCSLNGDLGRTLADAIWRFSSDGRRDFDAIVIETTGLATPETITSLLHRDFRVAAHYRLNGVVTVVDAATVLDTAVGHEEITRQVGGADRIIISKADLTTPEMLASVLHWVGSINPVAEVVEDDVLRPFDLSPTGWRSAPFTALPRFERHESMPSASLQIPGVVDEHAFGAWLDLLVASAGRALLRLKGIVRCSADAPPFAIHAVQGIAHPARRLDHVPEEKQSCLVLIGHAVNQPAVRGLIESSAILFGASVRISPPAAPAHR